METPNEYTAPARGNTPPKIKLVAGQQAPIKIDVVRKSIDELVVQYERKQDAAEAFADSIEAIAAQSGVSKKALKAYVTARAKAKLAEAHAGANQLVLLFEEV